MFVSSPRVSVHTEPIDTWVLVIRFKLFCLMYRLIIFIMIMIMIMITISDLKAEDEGTYYCHLGADPGIKMPVHLLVDGWSLIVLATLIIIITVLFLDIITMITFSLQNYRTWPE